MGQLEAKRGQRGFSLFSCSICIIFAGFAYHNKQISSSWWWLKCWKLTLALKWAIYGSTCAPNYLSQFTHSDSWLWNITIVGCLIAETLFQCPNWGHLGPIVDFFESSWFNLPDFHIVIADDSNFSSKVVVITETLSWPKSGPFKAKYRPKNDLVDLLA